MKKTLAAATVAALVGVAGAASAADLYKGGGSLKDAPILPPPPTWTGFYIGAHVGGAWGELKNDYYDNWNNVVDSWKDTNDGVFGGGTVGYNWQAGNFGIGASSVVIGFEADFGAIGFSTTHNYIDSYDHNYWNKQDASFYADVTGRLGLAFGPALVYAKGGWAYLDDPISYGYGSVAAFKGDSLDGWTIGGGIEYLFAPSWSVKAEYQYFDFGKQNYSSFDKLGDEWSSELTINTFKVGLNYHLNSFQAPLK